MTLGAPLGSVAFGEDEGGEGIFPVSIESTEEWGIPTIVVSAAHIYPASIESTEAWGTPSVVAVISPVSIESTEEWGTPWVAEVIHYNPVSRL